MSAAARVSLAQLQDNFLAWRLAEDATLSAATLTTELAYEFNLAPDTASRIVMHALAARGLLDDPAAAPSLERVLRQGKHENRVAEELERRSIKREADAHERARALTAGEPAVLLSTVTPPGPTPYHTLLGWPVLQALPTMLFGNGGSLKSHLALYLAGVLAQRGESVLYLDWELNGSLQQARLVKMFGPTLPEVSYLRCEGPLCHERDRIQRELARLGSTFVIFDSVGFAVEGAPDAADQALGYFRTVRQLGTFGSLHLAHVTKDGNDQMPFGSVFWHNAAQMTWFIRATGRQAARVSLVNRKTNHGEPLDLVVLQAAFAADSVQWTNVLDPQPVLHDGRSVVSRIAECLRALGSGTTATIADWTGLPRATVKKALDRALQPPSEPRGTSREGHEGHDNTRDTVFLSLKKGHERIFFLAGSELDRGTDVP